MNRKPCLDTLLLVHQGETREFFEIPAHPDLLLMVATDVVKTHNVVHTSHVPLMGQILTAMLVFWACGPLKGIQTYIVRFGNEIYNYLPTGKYPSDLHLRALVVRKLIMAPYTFIYVRRIFGNLWHDYYKNGLPNPYGIRFSRGLKLMSPLHFLAFAPTKKSETNDPENGDVVRALLSSHVVNLAYKVCQKANDDLLRKGVEIIRFKAEVGIDPFGRICLGEEWLTRDYCYFVETNKIVVGEDPSSANLEIFRKDAVRQWGGNKSGPPLTFPDEVIHAGIVGELTFFERVTGSSLKTFQSEY